MDRYNHQEIEQKWQKIWDEKKLYLTDIHKKTDNGNFYLLDMFPYPSGDGLHMGHTEGYSATDIFYRHKRMLGYNVLHPQGFDSFGLPAENYAIKTGTHPAETTETNSANYIQQWKSLGLGHDFDNIIKTSDPSYYQWTQWLFGEFYKNDLVYKKTDTVNWCDSCNTTIANEQVEDGHCERCKSEIIQKEIPTWSYKITDFADALIDDLETVDWPEATKKKQINWIGKSEGSEIDFAIKDREEVISVFTTRADTLFGATYLVLAPEHQLIQELSNTITNFAEVQAYIDTTAKKTELDRLESKEKTGVQLQGVTAINPANNQEIPVYIADYALVNYATGAVMAVPAHDERDFEFATKFELPINYVVAKHLNKSEDISHHSKGVYAIIQNSTGEFLIQHFSKRDFYWWPGGTKEGEETDEDTLKREIQEETGYFDFEIKEVLTEFYIDYPHDSGLGRKHLKAYRVVLHSEDTKEVNLMDDEVADNIKLMWMTEEDIRKNIPSHHSRIPFIIETIDSHKQKKCLPSVGTVINSGEFDGMSSNDAKVAITKKVGGRMKSTYRLRDWSLSRQRYWGCPIPVVYDPQGNSHFVGEENLPWLLPTDVDFVPTGTSPLENSQELKDRVTNLFGEGWVAEYDTMDTFVDSSWYFLRYPDMHNTNEFCSKEILRQWQPVDLYIGGAEHTYMHLLYARFFVKALHKIGIVDFVEPFKMLRHQGMVNDKEGKKMSKSKGNVVNPDDMVERFGADAVRTYMMFAAPLEDDVIWNEDNIVGVYRFLEKVWALTDKVSEGHNEAVEKELHKLIKAVGDQLSELKYNTAVSDMMKFINMASKEESISQDQLFRFIQLLSPYAPHIADEISERLGTGLVLESVWPTYNEDKLADETVTIGVQINGKRRGDITVSPDATQEEVLTASHSESTIKKWLDEGETRKVIYIPGKILNIIVG